jgi:hypothetical protein
MESLLIHPQDPGQLEQIKAYLNSLKIAFEVKKSNLPSHVIDGIEKAIAENHAGQTMSFGEFSQQHFLSNFKNASRNPPLIKFEYSQKDAIPINLGRR